MVVEIKSPRIIINPMRNTIKKDDNRIAEIATDNMMVVATTVRRETESS